MFISRTVGNTGKYKISNLYGLLVGSVDMLTCWKLIKLGTKHIISLRSTIQGNQKLSKQFYSLIQVIFS